MSAPRNTDESTSPVIEHPSWHFTIPEQGFCWCIDCQRTVWNPPVTGRSGDGS